jgi:hypothetical protein
MPIMIVIIFLILGLHSTIAMESLPDKEPVLIRNFYDLILIKRSVLEILKLYLTLIALNLLSTLRVYG